MVARRVLSAIKRWFSPSPISVTLSTEEQAEELLTPLTSPEKQGSQPRSTTTLKDSDTVGGHTPLTDWLGWPLHAKDWIVYPSESRGHGLTRTTTQMVLAEILDLHEDGGATVAVMRRSRTAPVRAELKLTAIGLANATRVAGSPSGVPLSGANGPLRATETDE